MKKRLSILSVLLLLTASATMGQNYQLPNPDFDNWRRTNGNGDDIPTSWHAFDDAQCNLVFLLSLSCGSVRSNHNNRITGYQGGYAAELEAVEVAGIALANGALSLGQTVVGSIQNNTTSNYIICQSNYEWSFQGVPDSLSFYAKQGSNVTMKGNSITKTFLYTSSTFKDVTSTATPYEGTWVGYSIYKFSVQGNQTWTRFATAFKYSGATDLHGTNGGATLHSNYAYNTDSDTATIQHPSKVMISFSTNEASKEGNKNEKLDIDMLRMIYDKGLSSVKINGNDDATMKSFFNAAEFLTHSNLTPANSGETTYNYPTPISCDSIPQVTATFKSKHISKYTITQASAANGYKATIYVKHNDNSYFYYYIQFTPDVPNITLNNNGTYTPCKGTSATMTASGAQSYVWSNSLGSNATATIPTSATGSVQYTVTGTGSNGCTATATAFVEVKPLPTVTINGSANATATH